MLLKKNIKLKKIMFSLQIIKMSINAEKILKSRKIIYTMTRVWKPKFSGFNWFGLNHWVLDS